MSATCCPPTPRTRTSYLCPQCRQIGKAVPLITPQHLLKETAAEKLVKETPYFFCATLDCPVVYFNPAGQTFTKDTLRVKVFQKEKAPEVYVCYCFKHKVQDIYAEVKQSGKSKILEKIKEVEMRNGKCRCATTNPQGTCCFGNVSRVVKEALVTIKAEERNK